jgi:hypothetical protein
MLTTRIRADLERSARVFQRLVWPAVRGYCGGGDLAAIEGAARDRPLALRLLDELAGIDYITAAAGGGPVYSIAARVQFVDRPYDTFTIREARESGARTELGKRMEEHRNLYHQPLMPSFTVQAYATDEAVPVLLSAAAIWTAELIGHVRWGEEGRDYRRNATDNATFVYVPWSAPRPPGPFIWRAGP